jgi:hypothetical protein
MGQIIHLYKIVVGKYKGHLKELVINDRAVLKWMF